ncbi:MAG: sigma-54 dependent transcriptional regulator [Bacteroidales bacterium]|nr:sigma-54 dependent transcriptional regulator [Bacteroidales bacterium]
MDQQQLQNLKNRYDIIGNDPALNRALEVAYAVAPTDLTVLIQGESGVGKETIPQIIHQYSRRKTGKYFAVNCGAIPEGTIDSELFGHEKGAFTGANEMRKGYFEEADGGTLFLDEIGELPLASQAKLLRVLQDGEFIRVGSSKVLKTDVRVVAATNIDLTYAVQRGKFRADLYYRLNAISIKVPSLRERPDDIPLLFRKFTSDFSQKYNVCKLNLTPDAVTLLKSYRWPGNIRQLKNVAESVSALESYSIAPGSERCEISAVTLYRYIPKDEGMLPSVAVHEEGFSSSEKEAMVRMMYQLRQEVDYLKEAIAGGQVAKSPQSNVPEQPALPQPSPVVTQPVDSSATPEDAEWQDTETALEQTQAPVQNLSIQKASLDLLNKALERHGGNRRAAAAELGISERTLYRKIKELEDAQN